MKALQAIWLIIGLTAVGALSACGGSSTKSSGQEKLTVSLSGAPATLIIKKAVSLTAAVANDPTNSGVSWSVKCDSPKACGSFTNSTTTSTTYNAPAAVPAGNVVIIKATSVVDSAIIATATIIITPGPIGVSIGGAPATLGLALTASLTGSVANDPTNSGVTWAVTCGSSGSGACGSFSNKTPFSVTYTAPSAIPTGGTVTITATSAAAPTISTSAKITIVGISVTLGPTPGSIETSGGAAFTAFVTSDISNEGVMWTLGCGSGGAGACGTLSAATSNSGVATDYQAPATVPAGNTVTVTATSVKDTTKSASATITVTTANTTTGTTGLAPNATYVFSLAGWDVLGREPYYVAGAFQVGSNGTSISGGEQDFNFLNPTCSAIPCPVFAQQDQINPVGSSISVTETGKIQITLKTCDAANCGSSDGNVGVSGTETLDAVLVSDTSARIIEFDSGATSSGTLDQQASTSAPSGGYAFYVAGQDANFGPVSMGGVLNIGGAAGAGSVFDINDGGAASGDQSLSSLNLASGPDSFGRVELDLTPSSSQLQTFNFAGYVVDAGHMKLVEIVGDTFGGSTGGIALGQGANTGKFASASVSGNSYVVGISGFDLAGLFHVGGVLTLNNGNVTGAINYNDLSGTGPQAPQSVTGGQYAVDPTGRVTLANVTDGKDTFNLQLYLSGQGPENEMTAISVDSSDILAGLGWQQSGGGTFSAASLYGNYVFAATGANKGSPENEFDAVGQVAADGAGTSANSINGTVDLNWIFSASPGPTFTDEPASGMFTANANGAFTGTITGLDLENCATYSVTGTGCTADSFSFYMIDTMNVLAIETDTNQLTLGVFTLQQ